VQPGRTFINATTCDYKVTHVRRNVTLYSNCAGRASFCFHETQEQGVANVEGQHAGLSI